MNRRVIVAIIYATHCIYTKWAASLIIPFHFLRKLDESPSEYRVIDNAVSSQSKSRAPTHRPFESIKRARAVCRTASLYDKSRDDRSPLDADANDSEERKETRKRM